MNQNLWKILKYMTLILGAVAVILPIYTVLVSAFKTTEEYKTSGKLELPHSFLNFDNFMTIFQSGGIGRAFLMTILIIGLALIGNILFGSMVAYVLTRFRFKFRKAVLFAYIIPLFIPMITTQVATFKIIQALGLFNTMFAPIVIWVGADAIVIFIYLQFMETIPYSLDEAAMLEGASYFTIYWKVIFPLLMPATATVAIIRSITMYNDFYIPFLYMPKQDLSVISTFLYKFQGPFSAQWNVICAGVVIVLIPTVIAFLILQKQIYSGVAQGSVK